MGMDAVRDSAIVSARTVHWRGSPLGARPRIRRWRVRRRNL